MTDLHTRFKTLDHLLAPNLWNDIEERAMAMQPTTRRSTAWVLIAVTLLLALAIGGAVLVGSGVIKLPVTVDASANPSSASVNPSSSAQASSAASSSPVVARPASWTATGPMVVDRDGHTATLLPDGKVLVAGGSDSNGQVLASAELYDPTTRTWTATAPMTEARAGHIATLLLDGRVLVVGPGSSAELYDPITGSWIATGSAIEGRIYQSATLLPDGKVLIAGFYGGGSDPPAPIPASAALYDPLTGLWTATAIMVTPLDHTATLLPNGTVLAAGVSSDPLDSAELYDPTSGTWTVTGNMIEVRGSHTATLLPDGNVLVAGGANGTTGSTTASAELYSPRSGSWVATGTLGAVRYLHTATLLADGRVLVAGGDGPSEGSADPLASAELYDPGSGSWVATLNMLEVHLGHTATLLADGTVLVVGGSTVRRGAAVSRLASAELFDPGSPN